MTDNTESSDQAAPGRDFRLPDLEAASARFAATQSRVMQGPVGFLFLLAGAALIITFLFSPDARHWTVLFVGLAVLALSFVLHRARAVILAMWIAALGAGISIAATLALMGATSPWIYWTVAGLFVIGGFAIAGQRSGALPLKWQMRLKRTNCRIGFFRPFSPEYADEAKNLMFPMLSGYGSVFFVSDETFVEAEFEGFWSEDYKALPGLIGGHRYTNEEWQRQVEAQLDTIDVAVIDISVPSANIVWEIKKCYDRLPSHRIVTIASASALPRRVALDARDGSLEQTVGEHITPILEGLDALDANPTTKPLIIVYSEEEFEGQLSLFKALHQAMLNIVTIETGSTATGMTLAEDLPLSALTRRNVARTPSPAETKRSR